MAEVIRDYTDINRDNAPEDSNAFPQSDGRTKALTRAIPVGLVDTRSHAEHDESKERVVVEVKRDMISDWQAHIINVDFCILKIFLIQSFFNKISLSLLKFCFSLLNFHHREPTL